MRSLSNIPHYTTVTGQTISPGGEFYAASTDTGLVAVARLGSLLSSVTPSLRSFRAHDGKPVYSITSTTRFLITGGRGDIRGWDWSGLERNEDKVAWSLSVGEGNNPAQVNWMEADEQESGNHRLLVGCGDGNVYVFDLETRGLVHRLAGHTDYVHSVAAADGSGGVSVVSGGEDGAVKLWDTRKNNPEIYSFAPYTETELSRPSAGRFISSVSTAGDWLVCGGGPSASLWNLSTRIMSSKLPPETGAVYATTLLDDSIFIAGQNNFLHKSNFGGESCGEVRLSSSCIYSVVTCRQHNFVAAAGSSSAIDLFSVTNLTLLKSINIFST